MTGLDIESKSKATDSPTNGETLGKDAKLPEVIKHGKPAQLQHWHELLLL